MCDVPAPARTVGQNVHEDHIVVSKGGTVVRERDLVKYMGKIVSVTQTCKKQMIECGNPLFPGRMKDELVFTKLTPHRAGWIVGHVNIRFQGFELKQDEERSDSDGGVIGFGRPYRTNVNELGTVPCWRVVFWPTMLPILALTQDCLFANFDIPTVQPVSTQKYTADVFRYLCPDSFKSQADKLREIMQGYQRDKLGHWIKPSAQREMVLMENEAKDGLMSEK
jgi:hypothetical protein